MVGRISCSFKRVGRVASTQLVAQRLARGGAGEGLVVIASSQTRGRGRKDRTWLSPRGGLYMSLILRPKRSIGTQLLPLVGAFAVAEGIRKDTGLVPFVRWPNDVMIRDKKVAGVIAESAYRGKTLSYVVVGMGVNANVRVKSLEECAESSTSLLEELGVEVDLSILRDRILKSFAPLYNEWEWGAKIVGRRKRWFSTIGRNVEITRGAVKATYIAEDIAEDGTLIVKSGGERLFLRVENVDRLREL